MSGKREMAQDFADEVWDALVSWKRARERFQTRATYETTHAYCDAVEELERLVTENEGPKLSLGAVDEDHSRD